METRIINYLTEHPQSGVLLSKLNDTIENYVWATPRTQLVINLFTDEERKSEPAKSLISDIEAFLKEQAIDNIREYKARKKVNYKPLRVTDKGIDDIIDYCAMYHLSQLETSRLLHQVVHIVQNPHFKRPSRAAFDFVVLWVQVWQARTFTEGLKTVAERYGISVALDAGASFKEFSVKFQEFADPVKTE